MHDEEATLPSPLYSQEGARGDCIIQHEPVGELGEDGHQHTKPTTSVECKAVYLKNPIPKGKKNTYFTSNSAKENKRASSSN